MKKIIITIALSVFFISFGRYCQCIYLGAPYGIIENHLFRMHLPYGFYPKYWQFPLQEAEFELKTDINDDYTSFPVSERYFYNKNENVLYLESFDFNSNMSDDIKTYKITLDSLGKIQCKEVSKIMETNCHLTQVQLRGNDYFVSSLDASRSLTLFPLIWAFVLLSIINLWSLYTKVFKNR